MASSVRVSSLGCDVFADTLKSSHADLEVSRPFYDYELEDIVRTETMRPYLIFDATGL